MSELIDLVNRDGEIVKHAVERDDAALYESLYMQIVIAVICNSRGEILVHKRARTKSVNGGDIDHVCGAVLAGETPESAITREALEEVGVVPQNLEIFNRGINQYGRYCILFGGFSDQSPGTSLNAKEVEWASYMSIPDLSAKNISGELTFVDGFFEDIKIFTNKI